VAAPGDFGCQVGERADDDAFVGGRVLAERARHPEVGDPGGAVVGDEHVVRRDVPVEDPVAVRGGQCRADLPPEPQHVAPRQGSPVGEDLGQRTRGHVFHDQVHRAGVLEHVVHRDGVRVPQPGSQPRLADGPFADVRARLVQELLDGHHAVEPLVPGPPHEAHRAAAEVSQEPVPPVDELFLESHPYPCVGR
jgi:hypothetical protein